MIFKGKENSRFKLFHDHTVFVTFIIIGSYTLVKLLNNYYWT
jgi:hypothetical protein